MSTLLEAIDATLADRPGPRLRAATGDDEPFLAALFADERGGLFAQLPPAMAVQMLAQQSRARAADYDRRWPDRERGLILGDGVPVGRIDLAWSPVDATADAAAAVAAGEDVPPAAPDIHLIDIVVHSTARSRGLGSEVLMATIATARAAGAGRLTLAVLSGNAGARRLYARLGFTIRKASLEGLVELMALDLAAAPAGPKTAPQAHRANRLI